MQSLRLVVLLVAAVALALAGTSPAPPVTPASVRSSHTSGAHVSAAEATPASSEAAAVRQELHHPGEPGYNVVAASQMRLPAARTKTSIFRGGRRSTAATTTAPAASPAPHVPPPPSPTLYNGLNKAGMTADSEVPPDSTGAIGPNDYVEMDNSNIAVYDRSLNLVSTTTLDNFLGASPLVPFCDVQVQWDQAANRWLLAFLYCNVSSSVQRVVVAWSKTSDPSNLVANNTVGPPPSPGTGGWCAFAFVNDPYLLDYPKLGHSAGYLVVGGNLYDETTPSGNPPFVSAGMEWAPLPSSNTDTSCTPPASSGGNSLPLKNGDGTSLAFTPVPVNNTSNTSDVYIVSAYDPAGNTGGAIGSRNKLSVWRLDGAGVLHFANDIAVNSYSAPSAAQQSGSTNLIDTLDGRLTQAVGNPVTGMYTSHTVSSGGGVSQVDWYEITASGNTASLVQQGSVLISGVWVYNAAVSPRWDGQGAAIFYNTSNGSRAIDIEANVRRPTTAAGAFEAGTLVLATSPAADTETLSCNVGGFPCRWGDYSGASPDPVQTNVVWGTNMFNTASGSAPAWSDQNFAVYAAVRPQAPSNVTARSDGRGNAVVGWTPSLFDPGAMITGYVVEAYAGAVLVRSVAINNGSATVAQMQGLSNGVTYTFAVFAVNAVGSSPLSAFSAPLTLDGSTVQSSPTAPPSRSPTSQSTPAPTPQPR